MERDIACFKYLEKHVKEKTTIFARLEVLRPGTVRTPVI